MVLLLAFTLSWLQGRFDASDAKKAIAAAMSWRPAGTATIFDALSARGEGDPQCSGKVVSQLLGDVAVRCSTPQNPRVYEFRILLDGEPSSAPGKPGRGAARPRNGPEVDGSGGGGRASTPLPA